MSFSIFNLGPLPMKGVIEPGETRRFSFVPEEPLGSAQVQFVSQEGLELAAFYVGRLMFFLAPHNALTAREKEAPWYKKTLAPAVELIESDIERFDFAKTNQLELSWFFSTLHPVPLSMTALLNHQLKSRVIEPGLLVRADVFNPTAQPLSIYAASLLCIRVNDGTK